MQSKFSTFLKSLPLALAFVMTLGTVAACDRGDGGYQQQSGSQQQNEPALPARD